MSVVRLILLTLGLSVLAACGSKGSQPFLASQAIKQLGERVKGTEKATPPTADQLRAAITPEFRAQSGNLPLLLASSLRTPVASIMMQAGVNGNVRTYFAPDSISFALRDGVLIASRGLGGDLMQADVSQVIPRIRAGSGQARRVHHYLDGEDQEYTVSFDCSYARSRSEVIETCQGDIANFTNRYVLKGGKIVVSVQWVAPQLGSFKLEDLG